MSNEGGPKEDEWNNFDEMIKRINSNLTAGKETGCNSSVGCSEDTNGVLSAKESDIKQLENIRPVNKETKGNPLIISNSRFTSDTSEKDLDLRISDDGNEKEDMYSETHLDKDEVNGEQCIESGRSYTLGC